MYNAGMNRIITQIFEKRTPDYNKLAAFGFKEEGGAFVYQRQILEGQFSMLVKVSGGEVFTRVTDTETGDEYTLFLAEGAEGSFVGQVRAEYESALSEIAEKCFNKNMFKYAYTQAVADYAREKYGNELEFLWEKFDDNAVLRRTDNNKWYAAVLTAGRDKLGLNSKERAEILDVRIDPEEIDGKVDGKKFFYGYHMNKRHWVTVILDGSVELDEIFRMLDESYVLAGKVK